MRDQFIQLPLASPASPAPLSRHSGKPRTGQMLVCEACGASFYRYRADIAKAERRGSYPRFCSKQCENGLKSATNVERTCPRCGKSFVVWASRVASAERLGQEIFCGAACRDAAAGEARRNQIEVTCAACGKRFMRIPALVKERNFCSRACFATQVTTWAKPGGFRHGYRDDLSHFVRSSWEANVARVLRLLNIPYAYESRTFRLSDGRAYRPDFHVAGLFWLEVKGWLKPDSAAKIARFRADFPGERLVVLGAGDYRALERDFVPLIPGWETTWPNWGARRTV